MEIEIISTFDAYPRDEPRRFVAGEIVRDIPKEVAALYVHKGLARLVKQEKPREAE